LESDQESVGISVALCTYNGERFLRQQLESISSQTVLPSELVISDDGSTDNTLDIVHGFAARAPFPVVIRQNASNLGFAQNFASCFAECKGDVIAVSDQDDIWFPDRIERTWNAFETDAALGYVFSDAPFIDEADMPTGVTLYGSYPIFITDREAFADGRSILRAVLRWPIIYGTTMAFRSRFLSTILPIPVGWSHDWWISIVLSSLSSSRKLDPVTLYRQHASQVVGGRDWTLADYLQAGVERESRTYLQEEGLLSNAIGILETKPGQAPVLLEMLREKRDFLRKRMLAHEGGFLGLGAILALFFSSDYWIFGAGLKTFAKDVLLFAGLLK
jgi:glycosyltransferase involved in cell wall biosynthesis